jgi:hypothetical protein
MTGHFGYWREISRSTNTIIPNSTYTAHFVIFKSRDKARRRNVNDPGDFTPSIIS